MDLSPLGSCTTYSAGITYPGFGIKDSLSRTTEVTTLCSKSGDGRRKICSERLGWRNWGTSRLSPCFLGCNRPCDRLVDRAELLRSVRRLAGEAQNLIVERTQRIGQALAILKSPYEKGMSCRHHSEGACSRLIERHRTVVACGTVCQLRICFEQARSRSTPAVSFELKSSNSRSLSDGRHGSLHFTRRP